MDPFVLNIETSGKICSVAVSEGLNLLSLEEDFDGDHTRVLNALIRKALEKAKLSLHQINAIAVNEGPGSFTALRVGVVTAKGISFALDKPLIMIPGLKMIATASRTLLPGYKYYLSLIDARRDEVYLSMYDDVLNELVSPRACILDDELVEELGLKGLAFVIAGSGAAKWPEFVKTGQPQKADFQVSAAHMIHLSTEYFNVSKFTETANAVPCYLKLPNITTPRDKFITH